MREVGVSFDEIMAHVTRTMEYRWYPIYEYAPSRFATRWRGHCAFLRNHKGWRIDRALYHGFVMSFKNWFNPSI